MDAIVGDAKVMPELNVNKRSLAVSPGESTEMVTSLAVPTPDDDLQSTYLQFYKFISNGAII